MQYISYILTELTEKREHTVMIQFSLNTELNQQNSVQQK